jgi:hypothetical protein
MSRNLTTAAAAAATAEVVDRTLAVELLFDGGAVRLNGSLVPITIGGQEFAGVGTLGGISEIAESADLQSHGITLRLSGIPRDSVALVMAEPCQGRRCTVWEVWLDKATGAVIGDPAIVFRGRMDTMQARLGETATVEVTAEDRLTDMDRPNLARYTDEDQRRLFPGDAFFAFVPATVEAEVVWPAASWQG